MYRVIEDFIDLQDSNFVYHTGDVYPRSGKQVTEARVKELASSANRRGRAVIALDEPVKPKVEPKVEPEEKPEEKPVRKRKTTTRKKKSAD